MDTVFVNRLDEVFKGHNLSSEVCAEIANRGFRASHISPGKKILFVGHNPSFRQGDQINGDSIYHPLLNDSYFSHYFRFAEAIARQDQ